MWRTRLEILQATAACVLLPTEEEPGVNVQPLAESTMFRSGMYTNVPVPSSYVNVSKREQFGQTGNG